MRACAGRNMQVIQISTAFSFWSVPEQEQRELLAQHKAGLDALAEEQNAEEQAFTDAYTANLGAHEAALAAGRAADADAYTALRAWWEAVPSTRLLCPCRKCS